MKTLIFLRHGKTAYTGQFPDLTDEGKRQICKSADEIADIVRSCPNFQLVSSPLPRALGTADIIAKRLGYLRDIVQEPAIRSMDFIDKEAAEALWKSFPNARAVDLAYEHDHVFEAGVIMEKRSVIQNRFFSYLGGLFERFSNDGLPDMMIHTSHFEVLWRLAATFGFKEPLLHGEVIKLELSSTDSGVVHVRATFREYSREFYVRTPSATFALQFKR